MTTAPPAATLLGFLPAGPVMGVMSFGSGRLFFIGDTNGSELVPQPLVWNVVGEMMRIFADGFETGAP